jgi:hypothetical protein
MVFWIHVFQSSIHVLQAPTMVFWHFLISNFEPIFNWISLPFMVQEMGQNWVPVCLPRTLHNKSPKLIGIFRFRRKFWDSCCIGRFSISRNKILKIWIEMVYEPLQCCFKIKITKTGDQASYPQPWGHLGQYMNR